MIIESLTPEVGILSFLIFIVAILYSSVGHGGASGYLAVMSFHAFSPNEMASTALILNVLVAGLSFIFYYKARYFNWRLTWPFLITSIPFAFIGGLLKISSQIYYVLLAVVLLFASWRLLMTPTRFEEKQTEINSPALPAFLFSGAGIGLLSGIIGVGGGIFLSPLMILMHWGKAKPVAATSALFIVVNAASGLTGRYFRDAIVIGDLWPLLVAGFLGALIGSQMGAKKYSATTLKKMLAVVLVLAAIKLILHAHIF